MQLILYITNIALRRDLARDLSPSSSNLREGKSAKVVALLGGYVDDRADGFLFAQARLGKCATTGTPFGFPSKGKLMDLMLRCGAVMAWLPFLSGRIILSLQAWALSAIRDIEDDHVMKP